jgi:hypothetical protein
VGGCANWPTGTSANLRRCGHSNLSNPQSSIRTSLAANDWICSLSLLKLVGLDWSAPDISTLCPRQKTPSVAIPYKGSTGPLHLQMDSTGIKAEGEGDEMPKAPSQVLLRNRLRCLICSTRSRRIKILAALLPLSCM